MNLSAVPVLMYHSVKYKKRNTWIHKHLTLELENFIKHLKFFKDFGYRTFFLDKLADHLEGKQKLPFRSVFLTFDDAYKDNWVFVYPLLKKYNIKATIWVNPEFVRSDSTIAPNLADYWNSKITLEELNRVDGFLSWEEMRIMEKSGLVDIQSHSMSHTKYPISNEIIDFVNPQTKEDWLIWNLNLIDKKDYLNIDLPQIPLGIPIYKNQKGNIARKCTEDGSLSEFLVNYVKSKDGKNYFNEENWKSNLFYEAQNYLNNNKVNYNIETEDEYEKRMDYELRESKEIIEQNLNKKVDYLCWPFGGWDEKTLVLAHKYGYKLTTAKGQRNVFKKEKHERVDRFSIENSKYQRNLFTFYAFYKFLKYKLI